MKNVCLLLSLLTFMLLFNACKKEEAQPQALLVTNGNIEEKLLGWVFGFDQQHPTNPNGYAYGFTTEAASSPQHSLKINCNQVKNDTAFCYYAQGNIPTTNIPTGARLTLKAKIKTVLKGSGASIVIAGYKDNIQTSFTTSQAKTSITGTQDFTEYSVVLDSYPGGLDNLVIFLVYLRGTTGYVYFDDVSLTVN